MASYLTEMLLVFFEIVGLTPKMCQETQWLEGVDEGGGKGQFLYVCIRKTMNYKLLKKGCIGV